MPQHKHRTLFLLPFALAAILIGTLTGAGERKRTQKEELSAKADYIFMEALRQNALGNDDAYYELLRGAFDLDSTDTSVGQTVGYYTMALGQSDSLMALEGYNLMLRHFNANPGDYYNSIFFGLINSQLGNVDEAIRVWSIIDSLNPDKPDVAVKYVEALQQRPDTASLARSLQVLRRVERAQGRDLGLTSHKIRAYLAMGDTAATYDELRQLIASSPRSVQYMIYAGDVFDAMHQPDSAYRYYDMAVATDSTDGIAYFKRGQYFLQKGDSTRYSHEVGLALRQDNLDLEVKTQLMRDYVVNLYGDTLRWPQISQLFDTLLVLHPHAPEIRDLYTSFLVVTDDLRGAIEQQEYALDADLQNSQRWRSVMSLYAQNDDASGAIRTGQRGLEYLPDDVYIHLLLGANYQVSKDYDQALNYFKQALDLSDNYDYKLQSQLLSSIGDTFYAREMNDSAFAYYTRAVDLDPDNLLALNNFAYHLAETDTDLDLAERYSAICVRGDSNNDTAIDTYAWIFYKKKEYEKAKEWIDIAIEIEEANNSEQPEVFDHAGDIYFMNRDVARAVELWEKALRLDPNNTSIKKKIRQRTPFVE